MAQYKRKVVAHYNKKVRGGQFLVGDLVLSARQVSAHGKPGKLESPREGPYLVRRIVVQVSSYSISSHTESHSPSGSPLSNPSEYRQLVGAFQYLCITRLDITYLVNQASQYAPTSLHMTAVKRILRYLSNTKSHGAILHASPLSVNLRFNSNFIIHPSNCKRTCQRRDARVCFGVSNDPSPSRVTIMNIRGRRHVIHGTRDRATREDNTSSHSNREDQQPKLDLASFGEALFTSVILLKDYNVHLHLFDY
ncbi:hypothetical protein LIER_27465 [Lithospermum erythrorhizon]|uniref:Mitochondrial protein n=1 Tax=Lithospermum erythrorhizon TaxID=34254 RepID=A0AAV3RFL2_LITER